jgi:GTPase SAR1 family protein
MQNATALIFVVDANDRERIDDARDELKWFFDPRRELDHIPVLIMANKMDLPNAMTCAEIADKLDLHKLPKSRNWYVQASCMTSGDGIYEGLDWLQLALTKREMNAVRTQVSGNPAETPAQKAESAPKAQADPPSFMDKVSSWFSSSKSSQTATSS